MGKTYIPNKLFANPSLIEGVARLVDLGGTLQVYNTHNSEEEADLSAIRNDWLAVGDDIKISITNYESNKIAPLNNLFSKINDGQKLIQQS